MQLLLTRMGSRWDGSRPLQLSTQSNYYTSIGYGHLPTAKIVPATLLLTDLCTGAEEKGGCDYESMDTLAKLGLSRARSDPAPIFRSKWVQAPTYQKFRCSCFIPNRLNTGVFLV